jgi:hypothetical protein
LSVPATTPYVYIKNWKPEEEELREREEKRREEKRREEKRREEKRREEKRREEKRSRVFFFGFETLHFFEKKTRLTSSFRRRLSFSIRVYLETTLLLLSFARRSVRERERERARSRPQERGGACSLFAPKRRRWAREKALDLRAFVEARRKPTTTMPPAASSSSPERAQPQDQHRSSSPARAAARVLGKLERLQAKVRGR